MIIPLNLGKNSYDIVVERQLLSRASRFISLNRKVLIVTDSGVPAEYAKTVAEQCEQPHIVTVPQGETSKSAQTFLSLLQTMLDLGFDRGDAVIAVGGGVVGDLAGFAAASYMRGIDFFNIPTTLLAQVDSSIGGKTAINFGGVKNIVGAFYQPKKVLIDPDVLNTLSDRLLAAGFAEGLKMAMTFDESFFKQLESGNWQDDIESFLIQSLLIKKTVVEQDEKEKGLRKLLNFGHTLGHGMEVAASGELLHGECVALGMIPMCTPHLQQRLLEILVRAGLPTTFTGDSEAVVRAIMHDKKSHGNFVTIVTVPEIGKGRLEDASVSDLTERFYSWKKGGEK